MSLLFTPLHGSGGCLISIKPHLGGGGIVLRLINRRPGDRRQHEQYFLPAPPPISVGVLLSAPADRADVWKWGLCNVDKAPSGRRRRGFELN